MRSMRRVAIVLPLSVALSACDACDKSSDDDRRLTEAIQKGEAETIEELVGENLDRPVQFRPKPRSLMEGEPREWFGAYLKYRQLIVTRMYTSDPKMCKGPRPPTSTQAPTLDDVGNLVKFVARQGADLAKVVAKGFEDVRPLHVAALFCQETVARKLLDRGASVDPMDGAGMRPVHWASCAEMTTILLEAGASPVAPSKTGLTPLHLAIDRHVVRVLVKAGAKTDDRDRCGNTPLHHASYMGLKFDRSALPELRDEPQQEIPKWMKLLVETVEGFAEFIEELSDRFDVYGELIEVGANREAKNLVGNGVDTVFVGGGSDWDD